MASAWLQAIAATVTAWAGISGAALLRHAAGRVIRPLAYLALLCFGVAAVFDILPQSKAALSWPVFVAGVASGWLLFWLIERYVAPICPACALRRFQEDPYHSHGEGLVALAIVLSVHCVLDGLGVSAASRVEAAFGLRVFAAVAVHKVPEGFALGLLLMSGRSVAVAVLSAAAIESFTVIGALIGGVWTHPSRFWLAVVLANIGGTFLYLCAGGLRDTLSRPSASTVAARSAV